MLALAPRAWDLATPADAALFLAPEGLTGLAAELPLPCRAVWLPRAAGEPAALRARLAPGVALLAGPRGLILGGAAASLRATAASWPAGAAAILAALLDRYERPCRRLRFADGEEWDLAARTRVMGVVNVTPDSFSDGGRCLDPAAAAEHALQLAEEGADLLDIGAESTRPGADAVDPATELSRLAPALAAARRALPAGVRISVDTRRAAVAREALALGADLINDVAALADPAMASLVAAAQVPVVLMHMRGGPADMQQRTDYVDLVGEVAGFLDQRARAARDAGIADDRILVDPGLGFGKSTAGNELLLRQLRVLQSLGRPVLIGASRKSFLGAATGVTEPRERLASSVAAAALATREGAAIVRVHDVAATRDALAVADRLRPWPGDGGA